MTVPTGEHQEHASAAARSRRPLIVLAIAIAGLLTIGATVVVFAIAGNDKHPAASPTPTVAAYPGEPVAAKALAEKAGCARPTDMADRPLFIAEGTECLDSAWTVKSKYPDSFPDNHVSFYVFGNNDGRDAWLHTAQTLGDRGVVRGDRWAVEIPDDLPHLDAVASLITERLSGERVF